MTVALAQLTTLRVGGSAAAYVQPSSQAELAKCVRELDAQHSPLLLIGGGSNLVVSDEGFDGTLVHVSHRGRQISDLGDGTADVHVAAGEPWDEFVEWAIDQGLSGLEALSGIPGSVGATPIQNVGAYGHEVAECLSGVRIMVRSTGEITTLNADQCEFGYRHSRFKSRPDDAVVLTVGFRLSRSALSAPVAYAELAHLLGVDIGSRAPAHEVRQAVLQLRGAKGMVLDESDHDTWSAGSFFTNPLLEPAVAEALPVGAPQWVQPDGRVKTSAAWLIDQAGIPKGWSLHEGACASVSTKHTLALTNRGGASTQDVVDLARAVRDQVERAFGVRLVPEPVTVGVTI